jgi:cyclopropane-fatty-acyl-phospholipid synthase
MGVFVSSFIFIGFKNCWKKGSCVVTAEATVGIRVDNENDLKARELFFNLLDSSIEDIAINFVIDGRDNIVGAKDREPAFKIVVHENSMFERVLAYGNLGLAEAYMDRQYDLVVGELYDFLIELLRADLESKIRNNTSQLINIISIRIRNFFQGRYKNVQSHYDIGDDLFESFLDKNLVYSCGYVKSLDDSVDQLQLNKFDRICQKLNVGPGDHLLDIGCGFGGLVIHAAKHYGAICTGITIAKQHCKTAQENVVKAGVSDNVTIQFASHKEIKGTYDRVVSVGMMEHLTRRDYKLYASNIKKALRPKGIGLIHTIGCNTNKNRHDPFVQKYLFPGSGQPKLSEIAHQLEQHKLAILDVENLARHYAITGLSWFKRFQENYSKLDHKKYDARFKRMWDYYLACVIAAGAASDGALYQVLFTNSYHTKIPYQRV